MAATAYPETIEEFATELQNGEYEKGTIIDFSKKFENELNMKDLIGDIASALATPNLPEDLTIDLSDNNLDGEAILNFVKPLVNLKEHIPNDVTIRFNGNNVSPEIAGLLQSSMQVMALFPGAKFTIELSRNNLPKEFETLTSREQAGSMTQPTIFSGANLTKAPDPLPPKRRVPIGKSNNIQPVISPAQTTANSHDHWTVRAIKRINRSGTSNINEGFVLSILVVTGVATALVFGGFLSPFALGITTMSLLSIMAGGAAAFVTGIVAAIVLNKMVDWYKAYNPPRNVSAKAWIARVELTLRTMGVGAATLLGLGVIATGITLTAMGIVAPIVMPMAALVAGCIGAGIGAGLLFYTGMTSLAMIANTLLSFARPNESFNKSGTKKQAKIPVKMFEDEKYIVINLDDNFDLPKGAYSNPLKNSQNSNDVKVELVETQLKASV